MTEVEERVVEKAGRLVDAGSLCTGVGAMV